MTMMTSSTIPPREIPVPGCCAGGARVTGRAGPVNSIFASSAITCATREVTSKQRLAVLLAAHQRDGFPLKAAHFPIGQNRLQPIADFDAGATVVNGVQDQHAPIARLASDSPLLEKIDGIAFDVGAVQRSDRHYSNLGVGFFVDLPADVVHLRDRALVENVGESR